MVRKRPTWIIYRKEVREALRDRKTLVIMVLLPLILYPLLFLGLSVGTAVQKEKLAAEPLVIGVSKDVPQGLRDALAEVEGVSLRAVVEERGEVIEVATQGEDRAVLRRLEEREVPVARERDAGFFECLESFDDGHRSSFPRPHDNRSERQGGRPCMMGLSLGDGAA